MKKTLILPVLMSILVLATITAVSATPAICGDGIKASSEKCDDGNLINGDGCSADCKIEGDCGNGIINLEEECDDGNIENGDGCSKQCKIEGGNAGSIWTTTNQCGTEQQDVNKYDVGENVYINGANFAPGIYEWAIKGLPGGASCDPDEVIATGTYIVDSTGAFCFNAYTVKEGDCKEYKVSFDGKQDNYNVVPEFGTTVGILTALGAVGTFFLVRRK